MAQIIHADKEIKLKVVYYGPALSGKTTNLIYVHQVLFPNQKVKLFSINTGDDRTLFFDLLPLDLGQVSGYELKMQLLTVPGQVKYNQTRRAVLQGADGVVFVADSQKSEQENNRQSYANLKENLEANHLDYDTIPLVLQYNKQDLEDILSEEELDKLLNERELPSFASSAVTGMGVLQTLKDTILLVLRHFSKQFPDFSMEEIENKIDRSFEAVLDAYQRKTRTPSSAAAGKADFRDRLQDAAHNIKVEESRDDLTQAQFLEKALETNIKLAELYNELNATKNLVEQKNRELTILGEINQALTGEFVPNQLPRMIFKSILMTFETSHGAFLNNHAGAKPTLSELFVSGFKSDPLHQLRGENGTSVAHLILQQKKPFHFNVFSPEGLGLAGLDQDQLAESMKRARIMALMSVPIQVGNTVFGLLNLYQMINESSVLKTFGPEEVKFLAKLSNSFALSLEKLRLTESAARLDQVVEKRIDQKVSDLRQQVKQVNARNRDCEYRLNKMETMLVPIMRLDRRRSEFFRDFRMEMSKPASSMLMAAKILEKYGIKNEENVNKFIGVIQDESTRLTQVLDRFDAGSDRYLDDEDFDNQAIPFADVLTHLHEQFYPLIQARNLEWREVIPENLPLLFGDREKMFFLMAQLVENAIQFTPNGFIEIKAQYDPVYNDRFVVCSVSDSGIGISRENLPHIFDRFFREDEGAGFNTTRFGLGLTLCKEIVEKYGGRIWAKSEEGSGTVVFAELPVKES